MPEPLPPTYARGVRRPYADLPAEVRAWVTDQLGGRLVEVRDAVGGFAPGVAAVVRTSAGAGFCKVACSVPNPDSLRLYRTERQRLAALPEHPTIPRPLAAADLEVGAEAYSITLLPALPGRPPRHPWTEAEATLVFDRLGELARVLSDHAGLAGLPGPEDLAAFLGPDAPVASAVAGDVPVHGDLRADNVIVDGDRVWFVDWAEARLAAAWVDPALLACDLVASAADPTDGGALDVWRFLRQHPTTSGIDPELLHGMMVSLGAALGRMSRHPAPPGLPTIRPWQRTCAETLARFAARGVP